MNVTTGNDAKSQTKKDSLTRIKVNRTPSATTAVASLKKVCSPKIVKTTKSRYSKPQSGSTVLNDKENQKSNGLHRRKQALQNNGGNYVHQVTVELTKPKPSVNVSSSVTSLQHRKSMATVELLSETQMTGEKSQSTRRRSRNERANSRLSMCSS